VIRSVVIHLSNEQPLLADLFGVPTAGDAGLLCTNLRMMDGKRPVFIDRIASTFFFPYLHIRFLEIDPAQLQRHVAEGGAAPGTAADGAAWAADAGDGLESPVLPVPVDGAPVDEPEADLDIDLGDIDEDFLKRVRDI
jgi:hypothetical protein